MTRTTRRLGLAAALSAAAAGLVAASAPVAWQDLTEADWLYALATRFADVDGHQVHYPTPTAELATLLAERGEPAAKRHLADARLALGDRKGAVTALEAWAELEGASAWAEAARWAARQGELALAFRAAAKALPGLDGENQLSLAGERVAWADGHPEAADPITMRAERAHLPSADAAATEDWIRALEKKGRIDEALAALQASTALPPERRLLLQSDLAADHGQATRAFDVLDSAVEAALDWPLELKRAFAERTDQAHPATPESWRATLEVGFEIPALVRLTTYFAGHERGDRAADLLRQIERRYDERLDRRGWLVVSRLHAEIDAIPEAFRARLAAAAKGSAAEQTDDLAALARLALRAGGRPLGWGSYGDEPYRWAARVDRTPGFWTGGVAFLLTGTDWKDALSRLEADTLPERTFATARALVGELAARVPDHAELPALRAAIMTRHVERGEGREALALLPLVESGPAPAAAEGRRAALLAMRQLDVPPGEELRVWRARLRALAPDGTRPRLESRDDGWSPRWEETRAAWTRSRPTRDEERYQDVLDEAISRLDQRDATHRSSAGLLLAEMDRLPDAEDLWLDLATRLESWNLDDDLGPRYEQAIERFARAGWWSRAARWYAARARHRELDRLAGELAARFRGTAVFERAPVDDSVCLEVPEQPRAGVRVRLAAWGDWVRLKALERFPHSPTVFHEARARLLRRSAMEDSNVVKGKADPVIVDDALLDERGWAVLFADDQRREEYLADTVRKGVLPARLAEWQGRATRTPVLDLLLFEGHARLSHFEDALEPASRLAALYPGDGDLARRVLSLQRSLASLDPGAGAAAAALVARTTPALVDPAPLWTELGEMEYERGRPDLAKDAWRHILDRSPRDPERISQLATVLWDYGEMDDALATIEDARRRLSRPSLLAFEAGVLHEEKAAIEPAVREYLNAGLPDESECFCSAFERDQRALRRLSQLIGRERVRGIVEARIAALQPGVTPDEETLVAFYPLTTIRMPDAGLDWTTDDWIDAMDHPVDPVARAQRKDDRERWRATMREGQQRLAGALLARTKVLVAAASRPAFLDAVERWSQPLLEAQPTREDEVALTTAVMARRAALATTAEDRITREMALARYLFEKGRLAEADEAWKSIASKVGTLPEGAPRMRAEAERAAYLERSLGAPAAAAEWERLFARYPWSLGILEDELAFLSRVGRAAEGRRLLESTVARAAEGHREALLERLAREALEAGELAQAQRAAEGLLAGPTTDDGRRLAAVHLVARLALRRDQTSDLGGLVKQQEPRVAAELRAELRAQVARAAALESAWKPAVGLWIEALNRRLDRGWLREACRAAERAGQGEALLSFFARQRERSPRDVRWAVALRELRLYFDDVPGALDAARAAIAVRPDRGPLWSETADLLARLGRPREGADLLAEWQKPRPADEQAAARRAALVTLAGDGDGALAIERAALDAFAASPLADEQPDELAERRGRAARRLLALGLPLQAFALLSPSSAGRSPTLVDSRLGDWGEAELALAAGRLLPLLRQRIGDDGFRVAAASVLSSKGRPEQREQVLRWIAGEVLKDAAAARSSGRSFATLWLLAERSSLDEPLRVELARRTLARAPGPWAQAPPEAFVSAVGRVLIGSPPRLLTPPLERMWAADLVRRARAEELWLFLAPRWDALLGDVRSAVPVSTRSARREWTTWLDDRTALALWAEAAQRDPARIASLASVLTERRSWDRFWALAARGWDTGPLVAALPDDARRQWFRIWQQPSPTDPNPALRARGESVERAAIALGRLVAGNDGAAADPVVLALRGPRTVGAVLDDAGPWQADLWGERPGPAWLVLEALSRLREKDPQAALVPLEVGDRGGETGRARIASRLAESAGNLELALALVPDASSPASPDLTRRLRLLQRAGRTEEAVAGFRAEVRRQQPKLSEASFRALTRIGEDLGLPDPVSLLDREIAVPGPFAATLCELRGLSICRELKTVDPADFRTALSARWQRGPRGLSAEETRFALTELWAREAGPLPDQGLRRLGGVWPHATTWLSSVRLDERRDAVAALDALPDITRLLALVAREGASPAEPTRLLLARVHLLRGDDDAARALLEDRLALLEDASRLGFAPVTPAAESSGLEGERADGATFEEATEPELPAPGGDAFVETLRSWLAPFRDAKKQALVDASVRAALRRRVESIPGSADAWALALDLTGSAEERVSVLAGLERAWRLGDLDAAALAPLIASAGRVSPADADRWLSRLSPGFDYERASARARLLSRLGRKADGARTLVAARARSSWTLVEEVKAFDLWRSLAPETETAPRVPAPLAWSAARVFWKRPPSRLGDDLAVYLHAHPLDLRVARVALRSVAPADPELMVLAERAIEQPAMETLGQPFGDARFLHLRAARALLPLSPRAARSALGGQDHDLVRDLERRRMPAADVRAALADLARLQGGAEPAAGDAALAALEDRSPSEGKELRAEIARLAARSGPPAPYRLLDGRPEPWRPRDLAWSVLETALDAEGVR